MKKSNPFRHLAAAAFACLLAASCSDVTDDSSTLPPGTYPMTFTGTLDGLTASRATTADGKTSWQAEDPVAISMDGGANHKEYKISNASTGAMVPNDGANTLYWSKRQETLAAWHPVSCTVGSNTGNSEVDITDQHSGFGTLENVLYAPAQDYTYSSSNPVAFTFRHALAKVKVTLQKGDGITDADLSGATVTFMGYTAGSLGYDGMTGGSDNSNITPKTETPGGGSTTYTALVIPQQMQGEKFIKVAITTDGAARDYFYIPTGSTDANLEAGKQYAYTITVKKTGLQVESVTASWDDNNRSGNATNVTSLNITIPTGDDIPALTIQGDGLSGSVSSYTIAPGKNFSITYTVPAREGSKSFIAKGVCDVKWEPNENNHTYTFTYSNIRSDLRLEYTDYVKVGDFYFKDGTWSGFTTNGEDNPCIGIVYWVGDITGDNYGLLNSKFPDGTHGLVVSLWDMLSPDDNSNPQMTWTYGDSESVNDWLGNATWSEEASARPSSFTSIQVEDNMQGYANTVALIEYNKYVESQIGGGYGSDGNKRVKPVKGLAAFQDAHPAPSNSSGWYWPSVYELKYVCWGQGNGESTSGKDMLNTKIGKLGGNTFGDDSCWSSTEDSYNGDRAWYVTFGYGNVYYRGNKSNSTCRVRPLLAF